MSLIIEKAGILTTIQDLGRYGFQKFGVNPNGAMDQAALRLINLLLGNADGEGALELHFPAPEIRFEEAAIFALGGAAFGAQLDGAPVENWRRQVARSGSVLKFTDKIFGTRCYLAVKGGFRIDPVLGSVSTHLTAGFGGMKGRKLANGDRLFFREKTLSPLPPSGLKISESLLPAYSHFPTVRIIQGAEFELLTAIGEQDLLTGSFAISNNSNRMGFRLAGKPLYLLDRRELVSSAVGFGTIQLLPDGQLIILMADHHTTGGYPRLGSVAAVDLPLVAQLDARDQIGFQLISIEEAERILLEFEMNLNLLKTGSRFRQI